MGAWADSIQRRSRLVYDCCECGRSLEYVPSACVRCGAWNGDGAEPTWHWMFSEYQYFKLTPGQAAFLRAHLPLEEGEADA